MINEHFKCIGATKIPLCAIKIQASVREKNKIQMFVM